MNSLLKRTFFGTIYVAILIGCVIWSKYSFAALMTFFTGAMIFEFLRMTMGRDYKYSQMLAILSGAFFFLLLWVVRAYPEVSEKYCCLAFIPLFIVMVNSLYVKDKSEFSKFANVYTSLLYIAVPMSIANFIVMDHEGVYNGLPLIAVFVLIWTSDVGAYLFGMALGQKFGGKLFESISPKKSWIGFWGGMFCTVAVSLALCLTGVYDKVGFIGMEWYHAVVIAILIDIVGVYGDLFESQWKRHYHVKDSGKIIPGHGGLMDRLDSTIFAVPFVLVYLTIFNLI